MGNGIAIASALALSVALLLCGLWCMYASPDIRDYVPRQSETGWDTIEGLKNWNFPYILKPVSTLTFSVEVLNGARANVLISDPDSKVIFSQHNTTEVHSSIMAVISGAYYVKIENPNPYSITYHSDIEVREFVTYRPLESLGPWFLIFSILVFGLAEGLWRPASVPTVRETNLSRENAYALIMDNFPKIGAIVKHSDEPNQIMAEVGDWKRWLRSSRPWVDIKVIISQREGKSRIEFGFDFLKMYGSYVAVQLILSLLVASVWETLSGGYAAGFVFLALVLLAVSFPFVWVTPITQRAKEQFMSAVDRFLPSVW